MSDIEFEGQDDGSSKDNPGVLPAPDTDGPRPNAIYSDPVDVAGDQASAYRQATYRIALPSIPLVDFNAKLIEFNKLNITEVTDELKNWRKVTEEAVDYYTPGGLYQDRLTDPKSEFLQGVKGPDDQLKSLSNLKFKKTDGELKGEIALLKVSKMLGLGDVISVPLPHSGIWVTIKPATERDLIDFYNSLFREKIMLGRTTFGLTLSNFSVHINDRLFDFILKHIHSVNFNDIPKEQLRNYLSIHDFPILAWGFACTMYPNGFDYKRPCVNDIEKCTHITEAVLNLTKLLWVDNKSLTEVQRNILSENRPNKHTVEVYRKYMAEHTRVVNNSFTSKNGIKFHLKVPTFNEYTADGLAWISRINTAVSNVILESGDEEEAKTELLNQYVKSSVLRQFNHFVDYIEFDDNVVNDRDTINQLLEVFSSDDDLRNEITEEILKFKTNTTIALIGLPEYKCPNPSCGAPQNPNPVSEKFTSVIPLDTINVFFVTLTYRISKILEREV